jgi:membrane-associated protease RseP (regulator of RpoE activity)
MPAYRAGLKEGDRILAVNGKPVLTWDELPLAFRGRVDEPVHIDVQRDGRTIGMTVTPMDPEGRGKENGRIGIEPPRGALYVERHNLLESLDLGCTRRHRSSARCTRACGSPSAARCTTANTSAARCSSRRPRVSRRGEGWTRISSSSH